jgi:hypothetical protein
MSTPEPSPEILKRAKRANWVQRLVRLGGLSWAWAWCLIALPFGYVIVLCSLVGRGPRDAAKWAKHCGLPWFHA